MFAEAVAGRAQVFGLEVFGGIGLDGAHALQVIGQPVGHARGGFARRGITRIQALLEPEGAEQDERNRQQGQHRGAGGERKEHRADQERRHTDLNQVVGAGVEEAFDLVDVFIQCRHQASGTLFLDEVRRQALDV